MSFVSIANQPHTEEEFIDIFEKANVAIHRQANM